MQRGKQKRICRYALTTRRSTYAVDNNYYPTAAACSTYPYGCGGCSRRPPWSQLRPTSAPAPARRLAEPLRPTQDASGQLPGPIARRDIPARSVLRLRNDHRFQRRHHLLRRKLHSVAGGPPEVASGSASFTTRSRPQGRDLFFGGISTLGCLAGSIRRAGTLDGQLRRSLQWGRDSPPLGSAGNSHRGGDPSLCFGSPALPCDARRREDQIFLSRQALKRREYGPAKSLWVSWGQREPWLRMDSRVFYPPRSSSFCRPRGWRELLFFPSSSLPPGEFTTS